MENDIRKGHVKVLGIKLAKQSFQLHGEGIKKAYSCTTSFIPSLNFFLASRRGPYIFFRYIKRMPWRRRRAERVGRVESDTRKRCLSPVYSR
uniref:Uncharacterized protein n=1 Tax=Candidatus Kentrum sp. TC TaxID=2126339 RepID=A0A450YQF8_9GAMM|nr:MAG: hypothetical protein BECKTC1821E_GA0114239_102825 [Candidatus Kentron sp. TC]VFK44305.1 MAG: hypothetical protein BECKTC1821D_GA0114238_102017 [Candidatus Kentron sp. TC]VFK58447.1 MAG: hypothetical protein BECKTC1821F_GA0114240_102422 [Candidatus Kentron sp. TC]